MANKKKRRSLKQFILDDYEKYQKRDRHSGIRRYLSLKQLTGICFGIAAACIVAIFVIAGYIVSERPEESSAPVILLLLFIAAVCGIVFGIMFRLDYHEEKEMREKKKAERKKKKKKK